MTLVIENNYLRRVNYSVDEKAALPPEQIERMERYKRESPIK